MHRGRFIEERVAQRNGGRIKSHLKWPATLPLLWSVRSRRSAHGHRVEKVTVVEIVK